jgi:group I intron endonuclease
MNFYIYQHKKADTNEIFYVGKGKGGRYKQIFGRNDYWQRVVNKHGFTTEIIKNGLDEELALFAEIECINVYKRRGIKLVNATDGGEGSSGYKHTEQHKEKLKGNSYGELSWGLTFKGKKHTQESKEKMSYARIGNKNKAGTTLSEESKEKISKAMKGKIIPSKRVLTDNEVREIRANLGYRNIAKLAKKYGVGESTIRRIRNNEAYKDIL